MTAVLLQHLSIHVAERSCGNGLVLLLVELTCKLNQNTGEVKGRERREGGEREKKKGGERERLTEREGGHTHTHTK